MKHICLAVVLFVALPLTADAQQKRSDDQRNDHAPTEQRKSDRQSDQRQSDQRQSAVPWWERQQTPAWEKKQTPAWEVNRTPAWETGNATRAAIDQQRFRSTQRNQTPNVSGSSIEVNQHRRRQYAPSVVYVLPAYRYFPESIPTTNQFAVTPPPPTSPITFGPPPEPVTPMGALHLEVEPRELLQVFVDGAFVGTPSDIGDELELTPGTHRIELRASGHHSLFFSAEIADGRSITYRGSLDQIEAPRPVAPSTQAPQHPSTPAPSKMYVIPGCYLGNVSPATISLPAGCDISKMTVITP